MTLKTPPLYSLNHILSELQTAQQICDLTRGPKFSKDDLRRIGDKTAWTVLNALQVFSKLAKADKISVIDLERHKEFNSNIGSTIKALIKFNQENARGNPFEMLRSDRCKLLTGI